jgi:ABC-type transport system involved in multi-copper enzyme maturation permease subunit
MNQAILVGFLGTKFDNTMTPVWLLGIAVLAGLVLVAVTWALLAGISRLPGLDPLRRATNDVWNIVREGVLFWVLILLLILGSWGILGTFLLRPVGESFEILASLGRLNQVGTITYTETLPGTGLEGSESELFVPDEVALPVNIMGSELRRFRIESPERLSVASKPDVDMDTLEAIEVKADQVFQWALQPNTTSPVGEDLVENFYLRNRGTNDAEVSVTIETDLVYPQVRIIPIVACSILVVFLIYFVQAAFMPRMSAVALSTFKSEIAQPLFAIVLIGGVVLLFLSIYIPYNTFGEDIKMLKDSGLTLIRVLCIVLAVWGAGTTITDEIEGRTALTVLSKPIGRRSFVIGKFMGIAWTAALMFILLGTVLLIVVCYKNVYDARETSQEIPTWQACYLQMSGTVPGLLLGFMETLVLASLSVAISTRLPLLANFVICFTIYVLGHLTPLIVQVTDERFEIVKFFGQLIATIFPNLESFDLQAAVAAGIAVPYEYLGWSLLYCFLFSLIAMLLALLMFEDRDLA